MEKKERETFQDLITKNTYKIEEENKNGYRVYSNRYTLALAFGVLLNSFLFTWQYSLLIAVLMMLVLEYRYRKNFLPKLKIVADVKPDKKANTQSLVLNAVLYSAFGIVLALFIYSENRDQISTGIGYALAVASIGVGITYGLEIYKSKR